MNPWLRLAWLARRRTLQKSVTVAIGVIVGAALLSAILPSPADSSSPARSTGVGGSQGSYALVGTVDCGGGLSADGLYPGDPGGRYALFATVGQPDAVAMLAGSSYVLRGGWQTGQSVPRAVVYLPMLLKNR